MPLLRSVGRSLWERLIVGKRLLDQQRRISADAQLELARALQTHFFSDGRYYPDPPDVYLTTPAGKADCAGHLVGRLRVFRLLVIPWLGSFLDLGRSRILEVGCGTGASTVSLVEQGAGVVGIDESEHALAVARLRMKLYGLNACFVAANAAELRRAVGDRRFDAIIFFAVLEHMTWEERRAGLRNAWEMLDAGQYLVVIETPNRLWHTDHHTSCQPFFSWLPDDVAFEYSRFTERAIYNRIFRDPTPEAKRLFSRFGRGVSYHDFVLSLGIRAECLPVASYMQGYLRPRTLGYLYRRSRFEKALCDLAPGIHKAFFCPSLYLALKKT